MATLCRRHPLRGQPREPTLTGGSMRHVKWLTAAGLVVATTAGCTQTAGYPGTYYSGGPAYVQSGYGYSSPTYYSSPSYYSGYSGYSSPSYYSGYSGYSSPAYYGSSYYTPTYTTPVVNRTVNRTVVNRTVV